MDLGATRLETLRLVVLPALWPAVLAAALLVFALSFDDFVLSYFTTGESPQPLPVRIWSAIRFGVTPTINAIGTLMLAISAIAIALAVFLPRLLGRRESGLGVLLGEGGSMSEAVRFEGVTKRFGDATAVDDLNLTIEEGEFFSLLGPSGCGKTTTLRMVAGFEQPTVGEVFLEGKPVANVPPYKRHVNTRLPVLRAVRPPRHPGQRRVRAQAAQGRGAGDRAAGARGARAGADDRARDRRSRTSCRAASASAWRSRGRW